MSRLNFGCGPDVRPGWVNVDRVLQPGVPVIIGDVLAGLPFPDKTFEGIVANHVINMITFHDVRRALIELHRVLEPGGTLRILVPNYEWAIANVDQLPVSPELEPTKDGRLLRYLFWHGQAGCCFTADSLMDTLAGVGFQSPTRCRFGQTVSNVPGLAELDTRENESLIVEAFR